VTSDWSLLLFAFCSCCFYHWCVNYSKLFKLIKFLVPVYGQYVMGIRVFKCGFHMRTVRFVPVCLHVEDFHSCVHRRTQGVPQCTHRAEKKFVWAKFTGESYECTPRQSKSLIFCKIGETWRVGVVI